MRKSIAILSVFSAILLCTLQSAWAQVSPPDGSTIHTSSMAVRLSWPGDSSTNYYLQVYASGREMFRGDVKGNSAPVPLPVGPKYQWKVSKASGAGYSDVGEYSFRLSGDLTFDFNGHDGASGHSGRDGGAQSSGIAGQSQMSGQGGGKGLNGPNGRDVTVELSKSGEFILVSITTSDKNESFLLDKNSAPILIQASGGHGGAGGRGGDGAASYYINAAANFNLGNSYPAGTGRPVGNSSVGSVGYPAGIGRPVSAPYVYAPGNGGNGGAGGNGGNGGNVTVISSGVDGKRYVQVQNEGGLAGVGGGPGRGGPAVNPGTLPGGATGYVGTAGTAGKPGQPGIDGRPGNVVYR